MLRDAFGSYARARALTWNEAHVERGEHFARAEKRARERLAARMPLRVRADDDCKARARLSHARASLARSPRL